MSEPDFSKAELDVLAGARRGLEPDALDAARVLHNTRLAIASGTAASSAVGPVLAKKIAAWLAIAGVSAWLGYNAGFTVGERDARAAAARHTAATVTATATAPAPEPPRAEPEARAPVGVAPEVVDRAIERASSVVRKRAKALAPVEVERTADVEAPLMVEPAVDIEAPLAPQPNPSLELEIKALRKVERALRNREPQRAIELLAQLDRDVVDGQMLEERAAARAMARCEQRAQSGSLDQAEIMQRVLEFSQQYPASVYFGRVRQTCFATIERDAATDSAPR